MRWAHARLLLPTALLPGLLALAVPALAVGSDDAVPTAALGCAPLASSPTLDHDSRISYAADAFAGAEHKIVPARNASDDGTGDLDGDGCDDLVEVRVTTHGAATVTVRRGYDGAALWSWRSREPACSPSLLDWPSGTVYSMRVGKPARAGLVVNHVSCPSDRPRSDLNESFELVALDGRTGQPLWRRSGNTEVIPQGVLPARSPTAASRLLFYSFPDRPVQRYLGPVVMSAATGTTWAGGVDDPTGTDLHVADDLDRDGFADIIEFRPCAYSWYPNGACGAIAARSSTTGRRLWRLEQFQGQWYGGNTSDLDGDGIGDLKIGTDVKPLIDPDNSPKPPFTQFISGRTGRLLAHARATGLQEVGDVDEDGVADFADIEQQPCVQGVSAYSGRTGTPLWRSRLAVSGDDCGTFIYDAADVDADSVRDFFFWLSGPPRHDFVLDGRTGVRSDGASLGPIDGCCFGAPLRGSVDGNGDDFYRDGSTLVAVLDGRTRSQLWSTLMPPGHGNPDVQDQPVDLTGDGKGEVVVASRSNDRFVVLDGATGAVLWNA